MTAGPAWFAVLSALLFTLGTVALLLRTDPAGVLTAAVLLVSGPVVALVGFTHAGGGSSVPPPGDALAFLALVALAGEAVLGAGLALLVWRRVRAEGEPLGEEP